MKDSFSFLVILILFCTHTLYSQWVKTNDGIPSNSYSNALAISGTNIFAGTSNGIYLSTSNGTSWNAVNTGLAKYKYISALAATGTNIFASSSDSLGNNGVYLSTNNGSSWSAVNNGLPGYAFVPAFAISGTNIFASTSDSLGNNGVYLSTNNGVNWNAVNTGLSRKYPVYTFAVSGANIFAGTYGSIYLSTNNGTSWNAVNTGLPGNENISALAASGTNIFAGTGQAFNGVYLSTNNGSSWNAANNGLPGYVNVQAFAISGTNIFAAVQDTNAKSYVYLSTNNGTNWEAVGLTGNNVYSFGVSETNLFAGTNDGIYRLGIPVLPSIAISSPQSGEIWKINSAQNITWSNFLVSNVKLEYTIDNGTTWKIIASSTPATSGSYEWITPNFPSTNCRIKVTDLEDISIYSISNAFTISRSIVTILSPQGEENWNIGTKQNITWVKTGGQNIKLDYTTDNGINWLPIVSSVLVSTGSYQWTIPNTPSVNCKVRCTDLDDSTFYFVSSVFTISRVIISWKRFNIPDDGRFVYSLAVKGDKIFAGTQNGVFVSVGGSDFSLANVDMNTWVSSFAISGTNIFAGTYYGAVYLSTDNGTDWTTINDGLNTYYNYDAFAISGFYIFTGATQSGSTPDEGGVFVSANNGASWKTTGLTNKYVYTLCATGTNIFAGTSNGVYLSTNSGVDWNIVLPFIGISVISVNGTNLFAGANDASGVYLSTNNGTSWINTGLTKISRINAFAVYGASLFAGTPDGIYLTTNNGTTWDSVNTGLNGRGISALAVGDTNLLAGTGDGVWYRPLSEMVTGITVIHPQSPTQFLLKQNYPNPFNPSTVISYQIASLDKVCLKVYDLLGREISTLVNEVKSAGSYTVTFNALNLPSGVYFYRLQTGTFTETKKLVLLR